MSTNISTQARNRAGDAIVDLIDVGSLVPNGYLEIRSGVKPSSPQISAPGILLVACQMSLPAFGNFTNGAAIANAIANGTVVANGSPGWFRVYNRDNQAVIDGDVTASGGGGEMQFQNMNFLTGGTVTISSGTANMPQ